MPRDLPRAVRLLAALALALGSSWAGTVGATPLLLPEGESAASWRAAVRLGAAQDLSLSEARQSGQPWVELQRTANPERWRLRVLDERGTLHEVEVPVPRQESDREGLVAMAVSLLHPLPSAGGSFWDGVSEVEEPPPLPADPPPLPEQPPPPPQPEQPSPQPEQPSPQPEEPSPQPEQPSPPPEQPSPPPEQPSPPPEQPSPQPEQPSPQPEQPSPPPEEPSPQPEEPAPSPEQPGPEASAPVEAPTVPAPPVGTLIFTRLLGVMDAGVGQATSVAPGGGVQVGVLLPRNLRAGVGFQLEGIRSLPHPEQSAARFAEQREADAHLILLWRPERRLAPVAGLRAGVCSRTVYLSSLQVGGYERRVVTTWTDTQGTEDPSDDVELPITPFPIAGLDLGLSLPLGPAVSLQPYAQLQVDLTYPMSLMLFEEQRIGLPWASLHAGLALHLEPHARSE